MALAELAASAAPLSGAARPSASSVRSELLHVGLHVLLHRGGDLERGWMVVRAPGRRLARAHLGVDACGLHQRRDHQLRGVAPRDGADVFEAPVGQGRIVHGGLMNREGVATASMVVHALDVDGGVREAALNHRLHGRLGLALRQLHVIRLLVRCWLRRRLVAHELRYLCVCLLFGLLHAHEVLVEDGVLREDHVLEVPEALLLPLLGAPLGPRAGDLLLPSQVDNLGLGLPPEDLDGVDRQREVVQAAVHSVGSGLALRPHRHAHLHHVLAPKRLMP
mmetsp:Transcript_85097/g.225982  ORF Transcript_85097/g.225982 Transcript_85097/m.225982 type:complete len:278 (-) Transcript_85097:475-1308(-)